MAQALTPEIITAAIEGLTARQEAIGRQIAELRALLPSGSSAGGIAPSKRAPGKRVLSAEARQRIAEAQRRRWAAAKGESRSAPSAMPPKKRKLSAAGRKAIQEAARRRWATKRAATAQHAPTTKTAGRKTRKASTANVTKPAPVKRASKSANTAAVNPTTTSQ